MTSSDSGRGPFLPLTGVFGDPETAAIFSEQETISGWLATERALARAQAEVGVLEFAEAEAIAEAAQLEHIDAEALWRETRNVGYPILPLVRMIVAALAPGIQARVHYGATTQDIMDTGRALQIRDAAARLDTLLVSFGGRVAAQMDQHRGTVLAARTHAQHAVPTTLGLKLAVILSELARQRRRLWRVRPEVARISLFGAGGTSAAYGDSAVAIRARMAEILDLESTDIPWHVARDSIAEFGLLCTSICATCGRFSREIVNLSRTEIRELAEPDGHHRGASSTMPQKANPIGSEVVIAMAGLAGALSSSLFEAMQPGHERAAGEWQIEWDAVPLLAMLAAGCTRGAGEVAAGLQVFPDAMRSNLTDGGGFVMAEAYMMRLAPALGREQAHDAVYEAVREAQARGESLESELERRGLREKDAPPLAPEEYLGEPDVACDAALAAWRSVGGQPPL